MRAPELTPEVREFWQATARILDRIPLAIHREDCPQYSTKDVRVSLLVFQSLNEVRISCWIAFPQGKDPLGVLVQYPAYATVSFPLVAVAQVGLIAVAVSVRGHHRSDTEINVGFPGLLTYGLPTPEKFVYRGIFCDALRTIAVVRQAVSRDLPIVTVGQSQGAALALVAAALTDDVRAVGADVPFLCAIQAAIETTTAFPYRELRGYLDAHPEHLEQVLRTLEIFDVCTYGPLIRCPVLMSIGTEDPVSPLVATRSLAASLPTVSVVEYAGAGHEGGGMVHRKRQMQWLLEKLDGNGVV